MRKLLLLACAGILAFGLSVQDAEAKRLGAGGSKGMQRESVTQRQLTPQPVSPAQQIAPHQATPTPTPASPVGKRSWLGPLAGLAAGIGLGALLSHFGFSEGMSSILTGLPLFIAAVFIFRLFIQRNKGIAVRGNDNLHYIGVGGPGLAPASEGHFSPAVVENRPSALNSPTLRSIPDDFDQEGFLRVAKASFIRLQAANDAGNLEDICEFTTPEMFAELKMDISQRKNAVQTTDVVLLEAELLEVLSETVRHLASVRFRGTMREATDAPALPFDEIWHLVKPADGSRGWAIAGIQQLN